MKDVNKRLCELLGCDVPRPKDTCPLCGKTNTDGKFIDGADFFSEKGRIDLLKRMVARNDYYRFLFSLYDSFEWPAESEYQQVMMQKSILVEYMLNDTGALAQAALEFLEGNISKAGCSSSTSAACPCPTLPMNMKNTVRGSLSGR